jgi:hypothetical protein
LLDDAVDDVRTSLLVLPMSRVLRIGPLCCVNVANLYLMRIYNRARELTVRHQLLAESLLLTLSAGLPVV